MITEIWREIPNYENKYSVSQFGRIKNIRSGKILKPNLTKYGYLRINFYKSNTNQIYKKFFVHRLVAFAFISNPNRLPYVNHKDSNRQNNIWTNLEWCTKKENIAHAIKNGRFDYINNRTTQKNRMRSIGQFDINNNLIKIYECVQDVEKDGFNAKAVHNNIHNKSKSSSGFIWKTIALGQK